MKAVQTSNEMTKVAPVRSETLKVNSDLLPLEILETEQDLLSQFRANIDKVEELNSRLHFVLNEVRPLINRKR